MAGVVIAAAVEAAAAAGGLGVGVLVAEGNVATTQR